MYILSGHVKKNLKVTDRFVNGGGEGKVNPQSATKIGFLFRKEKKIQNILKRKNMQKCFVAFLQGYSLKTFEIFPIFS